MISPESREHILELRRGQPYGVNGFELDDLRRIMGSPHPPPDPAVRCLPADCAGVPATWVLTPGADPDIRLLYLHGGGFVSGNAAFYLTLAARLSAAARCAVLLPDYGLAPEHRFPAGLEDCVQAHEWLTANGPAGPAPAATTFIAGDSAGGGLTLATLLLLRDRQRPLPAGGITLSAFADMTLAGESIRSEGGIDPILHPNSLPQFVDLYLGAADPRDPLASPVFADYRGIPPLLIQVGEHEVIRDDSVRVAAKAKAAGVDVTLEVWPGMFHVFPSHEPLLPEGREAIAHIAAFIQARRG